MFLEAIGTSNVGAKCWCDSTLPCPQTPVCHPPWVCWSPHGHVYVQPLAAIPQGVTLRSPKFFAHLKITLCQTSQIFLAGQSAVPQKHPSAQRHLSHDNGQR